MSLPIIKHYPGATVDYEFDLTPALNIDEALASVEAWTVTRYDGTSAGTEITVTGTTINGNKALPTVADGVEGTDYRVRCQFRTSARRPDYRDIVIRCERH